jgi:hypothetical protein
MRTDVTQRRSMAYAAIAIAAALAALVVGIRWGTFAAGGSDSSCYMNEARLFSHFTTRIEQPLAVAAPWPRAAWTFTPAGHLPSPARADAIVPMCPPGLPIVMAIARWVRADRLVVPLLGALAVWLTFVLGRRIDAPPAGAPAAVLVACSPIFLYQIVQPMTDVPAALWWLAVVVLASGERPRPFAAGLAASMAILTRPNLLPLALVVAIYLTCVKDSPPQRTRGTRRMFSVSSFPPWWRFCSKRLVRFGGGLVPGVVGLALLNWRMYGSPVASGYGSTGDLFALTNVIPNLERYVAWLWQSHTPILALALVAPFLAARRAEAWLALTLALSTILLYLPYRVFDDWWYIRFLLPAIPFLIVLTAATIARTTDAISRRARREREAKALPAFSATSAVAVGAMLAGLGSWWVYTAHVRHAFDLRDWEHHFVEAGQFAAGKLPANAAVVTVKHSGSVHYYSQKPTVAWDTLDPASLDRALDFLGERGLTPMLMIDTEEEASFREKFGAASAIGRLDWPPIARAARTVRVYDPADRARYWGKTAAR